MRKRPLFAMTGKKKPKKKWRVGYRLWNALKRMCMVFGAMMLLSLVITSLSLATLLAKPSKPLPKEMVLVYNAKVPLAEESASKLSYAAAFTPGRKTLRGLIDALDIARKDERVKGFVTILNQSGFNMAHAYELREAVQRFRESGKFAYIYAPSYGEMGRGLSAYYLASAYDEIWLQPVGLVSIAGIRMEMPFARAMLDKIGVEPQFEARKEYKAAFENITNTEMSPQNREAMTSLITSIADHMMLEIAWSRDLDLMELEDLVDQGILMPGEALEAGLIDRIDYGDRLIDRINEDITGEPHPEESILVTTNLYMSKARKKASAGKKRNKPKLALIAVNGTLVGNTQTTSSYAFFGGNMISAIDLSAAIRGAIRDKDVDVIVLRINSPGGTPAAAETVRRMVLRAQENGKKVVVSMGSVAASAAYWLVTPADRIFATPVTITGSIGVAGGKFNMRDMWEKIGIKWESVQWGDNANMFSMNEPFSEAGRARFNRLMDETYDDFVKLVAEGRHMSLKEAEEVAKGRPWTGMQANDIQLVDELGGLSDALDYAARLARADTRFDVHIQKFPKPKKPVEQIKELLEMQMSMREPLDAKMMFMSLLHLMSGNMPAVDTGPDLISYEFRRVE